MKQPKSSLPIILLAGPTAVGKTALSLDLASQLRTEIINADSMQVYRYMDIGTAKPTTEDRKRIPHHLLDIVDPDESFDAARYFELASSAVNRLYQNNKIPLVAGGTGLYMKTLTKGICKGPPGDAGIRQQLTREENERGLLSLHEELSRVDPQLGVRIHPRDRQRIFRALEVYRLTGAPLSCWQESHGFRSSNYRTIKIFLYRERSELYHRIDRRVHQMMERGFLEEVQLLLKKGYGPELKPMQALGYRQLVEHLQEKISLEKAVQWIQRETRHYAKRQLTWFRGDPEFVWFQADKTVEILDWIQLQLGVLNCA